MEDDDDIILPDLSIVPSGTLQEKPETPEAVRKLLHSTKTLDLDDISFSGSEISDAFADISKDVFTTIANTSKPKNKRDFDLMIMSSFTENYKQTMEQLEEEQKISKNMTNENQVMIDEILDKEHEPEPLSELEKQAIAELLKDYTCSTPSEISEEGAHGIAGLKEMSEYWQNLTIDEAQGRFKTSAPGYSAFARGERYWIKSPSVPWETLELSKNKCEAWLNEQEDDST